MKIEQLSKKQIISEIVNWIKNSDAQYGSAKTIAAGISSGAWLKWLDEQHNKNIIEPHFNS